MFPFEFGHATNSAVEKLARDHHLSVPSQQTALDSFVKENSALGATDSPLASPPAKRRKLKESSNKTVALPTQECQQLFDISSSSIFCHTHHLATHTSLLGGAYRTPTPESFALFQRAYLADIIADRRRLFKSSVGSPTMTTTNSSKYLGGTNTPTRIDKSAFVAQSTLSEFGNPAAFRLNFDMDLICIGPPTPADQAIIGIIMRTIQEAVKSCWPKDTEWKKDGEIYVTQTLARIKDQSQFLRERMLKRNGIGSNNTSNAVVAQHFLSMSEDAMDGFSDFYASAGSSVVAGAASSSSNMSPSLHSSAADWASSNSSSSVVAASTSSSHSSASTIAYDLESIFCASLSSSSSALAPPPPLPHEWTNASSSEDASNDVQEAASASAAADAARHREVIQRPTLTLNAVYRPLSLRLLPKELQIVHKIGTHSHFLNIVVSSQQATRILDHVRHQLATQISMHFDLVNASRLCLVKSHSLEFTMQDLSVPSLVEFWGEMLENTFTPRPRCKSLYSHKVGACVLCKALEKRVPDPNCPVCSYGRGKASYGPAAVGDLIYALDGDGNCLERVKSLLEDESGNISPSSAQNYFDPALNEMASLCGITFPAALVQMQRRYDPEQYRTMEASLRSLNLSVHPPAGVRNAAPSAVISSIPMPLRRFPFFKPNALSAAVEWMLRKTSIVFNADFSGATDAAIRQTFHHPPGLNLAVQNSDLSVLTKQLTTKNTFFFTDMRIVRGLQQLIRSMRPEWENLSFQPFLLKPGRSGGSKSGFASENNRLVHLGDDARRSVTSDFDKLALSYTGPHCLVQVHGPCASYCTMVNRKHSSRKIYFVISPTHIQQRCPSKSTRGVAPGTPVCEHCVGMMRELPLEYRDALFPNPTGMVGKVIAEADKILSNRQRSSLVSSSSTLVASTVPSSSSNIAPPSVSAIASSTNARRMQNETAQQVLISAGYVLPTSTLNSTAVQPPSSSVRLFFPSPALQRQ